MIQFYRRIKQAFNLVFKTWGGYWDKPNGCCSQCGAPLNEYMIGGYKLHDGKFSVKARINESE